MLTTTDNYVNLATMKAIQDIGRQLVECAEKMETFNARRGLIGELFPYIFVASQRMSLRAISRWLATERKIRLSPQAIAKAMQNPEKYWARTLEGIEPAVRIVAGAHDVSPLQILSDPQAWEYVQSTSPGFSSPDDETFRRYRQAVQEIVEFKKWMPPDALRECLGHAGDVFGEESKRKGATHERKRTGKKH